MGREPGDPGGSLVASGLKGGPGLAPIVLAAIVYNFLLSIPGAVADVGMQPNVNLLLYLFDLSIIYSCISIFVSLLLDLRVGGGRRVTWQFVSLLSFTFAVIGLPFFWFVLPMAGMHLVFSDFLFAGLITGAINCAVWSILHLCIRSVERAVAQERRTAALREVMLRYENEALSYALDPVFFVDALMRIAQALNEGGGALASEVVMSLAEHMRAALAPSDVPPEISPDEPFAGFAGRAESGEIADTSLRRLLLVGALGVWAALFCALFFMDASWGRLWWKSLSDYGVQSIVGALWFVVAGRILQKAMTYRVQVRCLIVFVTCVLGICTCAVFLYLSFALRGALAWPPLVSWIFDFELGYVMPIFIGWAALYLLIDARRREIARLNAAAEIREAALNARNAMLRLQVNPHFLFNALNALYALILDRQFGRAQGMIAAVRRFLDRAGDPASGELVALSSELAIQDAYLEIERMRFGDRLRVERRIDAELSAAMVPHLILQPLVENAVKYAVARTDRPVAVEIRAWRAGQELVLAVVDTGAPEAAPRAPGLGVGLRNVEARLKSLYGEAGRLACRPLDPAGFLAEVRLPLSL